MRTTIKRLVIGLLFGLIALFAHAQAIQAAQPVADFAMTIIPPDNQADKQLSYFDLVVQPKQQQDLQIKLVNHKVDCKINPNAVRTKKISFL
ncbi:WxL protein peptidoglycan domain-containing protein [Latilactobacillus sakei]|uniref:WxL protein peptidoglycan domain-containing protein n=1 Tax=Latilactobacillus sakei TaxID=1599 RepID=UPI003884D2C3